MVSGIVCWIYVNDHCEAINFVLEKGERGEIYNISSGGEKSNSEVVNEILDMMGKKNLIEFVEDRPGHDVRYSLESSKIFITGGSGLLGVVSTKILQYQIYQE